jgi:AcrR family transcriptional regulator
MSKQKRLPGSERKRQIAEAALEILASQGVHRLTAVALAKRVGITDGAIFRHFKNKKEIVEAAIAAFETTLESSFPKGVGDPLERIGCFVVQRLELVRKRPEILRLAFNDRLAEAAGEEGAARVQALVKKSVKFLRDAIREAQQKGQLASDLPTELFCWAMIGVIRGASALDASPGSGSRSLARSSPKKVWAQLEEFLKRAAGGTA